MELELMLHLFEFKLHKFQMKTNLPILVVSKLLQKSEE